MEMLIVFSYAVVYLLAVLCPLIPAVLIYKLFPDTKVSVSGPLSGLTLRAGGAFAAYVITFLLPISIMLHFRDTVDSFVTPVWTVTGKLSLVDENGLPVTDPDLLNGVTIEYFPNLSEEKFGQIKLKVPVSNRQWPSIHIGLPQLGSNDLVWPFTDLKPEDNGSRSIDLRKPVEIKLNRSQYNPDGSNHTGTSH